MFVTIYFARKQKGLIAVAVRHSCFPRFLRFVKVCAILTFVFIVWFLALRGPNHSLVVEISGLIEMAPLKSAVDVNAAARSPVVGIVHPVASFIKSLIFIDVYQNEIMRTHDNFNHASELFRGFKRNGHHPDAATPPHIFSPVHL
jgi:hypothetical protein